MTEIPMNSDGDDLAARRPAHLRGLNRKQLDAVEQVGNVAVLAGPGTGKTRVIASRIARILKEKNAKRTSIAAITYTNAAADEMSSRVFALGVTRSRRLSVSTAHSFFLTNVLLKYSMLLEEPFPANYTILSEDVASGIRDRCIIAHGLDKWKNRQEFDRLLRTPKLENRSDVSPEMRSTLAAVADYRRLLAEKDSLDYESIISRTVTAFEDPVVLKLFSKRYTNLIVDEYQDLGPALHGIVKVLEEVGVEVFVVGDPNQSVMGFVGANPKFLLDLYESESFYGLRLERNYRSGSRLIEAAQNFLDSESVVTGARNEIGSVFIDNIAGDQYAHARRTRELIVEAIDAGVAPGKIAVLYPRSNPFLDAILLELQDSGVDFVHERSRQIPRGRLARWVARCAGRYIRNSVPGGELPVELTIRELASELMRIVGIHSQAVLRDVGSRLARFFASCDESITIVGEFLDALLDCLPLLELVECYSHEQAVMVDLTELTSMPRTTLVEMVSTTESEVVVLTTYQSSKGREFDVVIMPGLVEGAVPRWANTGPPDFLLTPPLPEDIAEERRAFYVAITRARDALYLIGGSGWRNKGGFWQATELEVSSFLGEFEKGVQP